MSDKERIELIMRSYNLTPSQFADRAGIQRASVSHILSGRNKPSLEVMLKIYESFPGLDMTWLMTGKGVAPTNLSSQPIVEEQLPLSMPDIFASQQNAAPLSADVQALEPSKVVKSAAPRAERIPRRAASRSSGQSDTTSALRKIKEIRIYYTDGTYEIMVPEK